ncbi:Polymerase/histidinol phosphatase-like protein [Gorgonomyces haynaldii]|nr:Polymerase/histidinol phosphatase-like protein [Gorgonomyces haynaldii]
MLSAHSHSGQFCLHAHGTLEQVVLRAIEKQFVVYGLTEHMPRTRTKDMYPEESGITPKDTLTMFDAFYKEAQRLKAKYPQIELLIGMEIEWIHDKTFQELEQLLATYELDYVVGSVHHCREEPIDYSVDLFPKGDIEQLFLEYFDDQFQMLQKVHPRVIGHFDLIRLFHPTYPLSDAVFAKIDRNIDYIAGYGGIVEINSRAWKKNLPSAYPFEDVLERMKGKVKFTISDDAHGPDDVGMHYDLLWEHLRKHQLQIVTPTGRVLDWSRWSLQGFGSPSGVSNTPNHQ